jgi:hypothetical protein
MRQFENDMLKKADEKTEFMINLPENTTLEVLQF